MAFSKALNLYRRVDTVSINCGTFEVELRAYASVFKDLGNEQARLRSIGELAAEVKQEPSRKRATASASRLMPSKEVATPKSDTPDYFLGTRERDIRFFAEHVMVNWSGLRNDEGIEVAFSPDMAMELFNSEGGDELYAELLMASLDVQNFVATTQLANDAKN